jgi:hypothetical protein
MNNISLLSLVTALALSSSCFAEQWDSVVSNDSDSVYFYDPNTVKRNGDLVQYWELTNYTNKLKVGTTIVSSSKTLIEVDCKNSKYRTIRVIDYDKDFGKGNIVNTGVTQHTKWFPSPKESVSSEMELKVCSYKGRL